MTITELPLPPHYDPDTAADLRRIPYQQRAEEAAAWAKSHDIPPADRDRFRVGVLLIDLQNTFCLPEFELFVAGRTGHGAVEDCARLCRFIYRYLPLIHAFTLTMDTHMATQIFHPCFWMDETGQPPLPLTVIRLKDIEQGKWQPNPFLARELKNVSPAELARYVRHYARQLGETDKYDLMIWPYHAMLGGIGHALVPAVEEAVFFHAMARHSQPYFRRKGDNPLTEHYSALSPEVTARPDGTRLAEMDHDLVDHLLSFDRLIVAGQAKSHCVIWTLEDLAAEIEQRNPALFGRIYLLEDCMSPVVIPDVVDFTDEADEAFTRFAKRGMHRVASTDLPACWPDFMPKS
ncbi:MAG: isochorismatase [Acidobacteria bacterium]|nr:isochorismatase [Acidobacteriota bacterium]